MFRKRPELSEIQHRSVLTDAVRAFARSGQFPFRVKGLRACRAASLFVTTALPYANGPFHIGHIMEYIQADIWVRFQSDAGRHAVHFVCADDTHGAPIMLAAEAEGVTPRELVARVAADAPEAPRRLSFRFDHW